MKHSRTMTSGFDLKIQDAQIKEQIEERKKPVKKFINEKVLKSHVERLFSMAKQSVRVNSCEGCTTGERKHYQAEMPYAKKFLKIKPINAESRLVNKSNMQKALSSDQINAASRIANDW